MSFQYRLRFCHRCRSQSGCDQTQVDRLQVQGSVMEATCGAPVHVALCRHRHDPEGGISREAQRMHFAHGKTLYTKAIVVPADRVLSVMDSPLLHQPPLNDTQGRNIISGPDVSADGCIYATPMEQNGIGYLDNFTIALPWNEHTAEQRQSQQGLDWSGSAGGPGESAGGGGSAELCLVVQLLTRNREGKWDVYDMPHLVSRPFQVVPRSALLALRASPALPGALLHPSYQQSILAQHQLRQTQLQLQQQHPLLNQQQHMLLLRQQRQSQAIGGLVRGPSGSVSTGGAAPNMPGPQHPQQPGGGDPGLSFSPGTLPGGSPFGTGQGAVGSPLERRRSSNASVSTSRPRRRSCLSRDSNDDGMSGGLCSPLAPGTIVVGPASVYRTGSGERRYSADTGTSGLQPLAATSLGALAQANASATAALSQSMRPAAPRSAELPAGAVLFSHNPTGIQVKQEPSASLLDLHSSGLQELLDELESHPLAAGDLMELEAPHKRVKGSFTVNTSECGAAFQSDLSSNSLLSASHTSSMVMTSHGAQQHLQNLQQAQMDAFMTRSCNTNTASGQGGMAGGGAQLMFMGSHGGNMSTGSCAEPLYMLRQMAQAGGGAAPVINARSPGGAASMPSSGGGRISGSGRVSGSGGLDALVHLLSQPGRMEEALDRMAEEERPQEAGNERPSDAGAEGMQM